MKKEEYNGYAVVIETHEDFNTKIEIVCATKDENVANEVAKKEVEKELAFMEENGIEYEEFDYTDNELNGIVESGSECENSIHIYIKRTNVI